MEVILPILVIAIVSNLVSGFVKERVSMPLTQAAVRALARRLGRATDERLVPRRLWIAAGLIVYLGWAILGFFIGLLAEIALLALLLPVACLLTGIYYGNKLYNKFAGPYRDRFREVSP
jgi:hypothetical protein